MTRKKVKLAFITNDSARKATFKKRKKGLMKKVSELSTLCGIEACAIIYSPYESQPEVWPNNSMGVQRVLAQFKRMPEMEQSKKMVNQESFIRQRIAKANEQLKKLHKDNREKEMTQVMFQCLTGKGFQGFTIADLNDMGWLIDQNLKDIYKRIESIKKMSAAVQPVPATVTAADVVVSEVMPRMSGYEEKPAATVAEQFGGGAMDGMQRPHQWFSEWMNNPSDHIGFGHGDEMMMMPFGDHGNNSLWSSAFFP